MANPLGHSQEFDDIRTSARLLDQDSAGSQRSKRAQSQADTLNVANGLDKETNLRHRYFVAPINTSGNDYAPITTAG